MHMVIPVQDDQVYDWTMKCAKEFGKQIYPLKTFTINGHCVGSPVGGSGVVIYVVGINDISMWEYFKTILTREDEICILPSIEFETDIDTRTSGYGSLEEVISVAGRRCRRMALFYTSLIDKDEHRKLAKELKPYWEEKWGEEIDLYME